MVAATNPTKFPVFIRLLGANARRIAVGFIEVFAFS